MLDFDTLYREYAPRVHRFVLGLSGNHATAEDVTAETFVRVWATRDSIRHETVRAFLFTIARNLWLQGIRSNWRRQPLDVAGSDPAPGPEVTAGDRIALNRVLSALAALDAGDRAAILMRAQEDLSYEEIAQSLRISVAAAKVRVHRARKKLKELSS
ncbi:MAG TPA: RNA polymerase sigma factor [Vicinamibacterales bacterium]|nr:RNA polymerase sigma factor [Vicinamibacterales bacterium]